MATLTAEQQKYLNTLEDVAKLIQKTQSNLKKMPESETYGRLHKG